VKPVRSEGMKTEIKIIAAGIIVLTAILLIAAVFVLPYSGPGGYTVKPGTGLPSGESAPVAVDAPVISFWQLPLWVQVVGGLDSILLVLGTLSLFPAVLGKVQNVLDNRNRKDIFDYVLGHPGCTPAEITSRQNMKNGTVKYHIQMLESQGKVILKRMGKYTRIFNTSHANSDLEKTLCSYTKNETSKNLLCAIMEEPGVTNQRLSERFSIDKSSVHWHMERFLNDNLIKYEQDGRYKKYFLEPKVLKLLGNQN